MTVCVCGFLPQVKYTPAPGFPLHGVSQWAMLTKGAPSARNETICNIDPLQPALDNMQPPGQGNAAVGELCILLLKARASHARCDFLALLLNSLVYVRYGATCLDAQIVTATGWKLILGLSGPPFVWSAPNASAVFSVDSQGPTCTGDSSLPSPCHCVIVSLSVHCGVDSIRGLS